MRTKSKFKDDMKDFILYKFINSASYNEGIARAKLLEDFSNFTPLELSQILKATKNNNQIHEPSTASY